MFKTNKYSQIYFNIVNKAKSRKLAGYTETHHILPRSLGGTNDSENLVELTAREHYICHLLLPKITTGESRYKMIYAYIIMSGRKIYGSRKYAFYREEHAKINSELRSGSGNGMWGVNRSGDKNTFYGKKHSEETKRKISEKKKGQGKGIKKSPFTEEHRKNISNSQKKIAKKYTFIHPTAGEFYGSTGDLARAYNFSRTSEAYKLVKGEYKSYKGWTLKVN
jgi:hypothetical protein